MKIAIVCPYPLDSEGGVQRHIKDFYAILKKRGYYVKLVSPSKTYDNPDHITFGTTIEMHGGKLLTNGSRTYYSRPPRFKGKLPEEFDIIHTHEPMIPFFFYGIIIAASNDARKVATIHALNPLVLDTFKLVSRPFVNALMKQFDHIFASSKVSAAPYLKTGRPVTVMPNGVDVAMLNPSNEKIEEYRDGKKNILFLGRFDERKGLRYLLESWPEITRSLDNEVRLIVAGGSSKEEREEIDRIVEKLPNKENIIFEGRVSEERKASLLVTSDIFVSPATGSESFGMVLTEAMASGTPVVGFDNPGYRTVLEEQAKYCIAELRNTDDLTRKILTVLHDHDLANSLVHWGLKQVKEKYDWEIVADRIIEVYKDLAD